MEPRTRRDFLADVGKGMLTASIGTALASDLGLSTALAEEKARALESRGRQDVIRALASHCIGYRSNFHSIQPAPAV